MKVCFLHPTRNKCLDPTALVIRDTDREIHLSFFDVTECMKTAISFMRLRALGHPLVVHESPRVIHCHVGMYARANFAGSQAMLCGVLLFFRLNRQIRSHSHAQIRRVRGVQHERCRARRVRHSCRAVTVPEAVCFNVADAPVAVICCQS